MPPSKNISFDELSKFFHLPINQVAKELNVCATILKKICRRNGIPRWPHRKIKSLDKLMSNLEMNILKNPQEKEEITKEIEALKTKKKEILKNPNILVSKGHQDKELSNKGIVKMQKKPTQPKYVNGLKRDGYLDEDGNINCFLPVMNNERRTSHGYATQTQPQPQAPVRQSFVEQNAPVVMNRQHNYVETILNGGFANTPIMTTTPNLKAVSQTSSPQPKTQTNGTNMVASALLSMKREYQEQSAPSSLTPSPRKNPADLSSYSYDPNALHAYNLSLVMNPIPFQQISTLPPTTLSPSSQPISPLPKTFNPYNPQPSSNSQDIPSTPTSSVPSFVPRTTMLPKFEFRYPEGQGMGREFRFGPDVSQYGDHLSPLPFIPSIESISTTVSQSISTINGNGNSINSLIN